MSKVYEEICTNKGCNNRRYVGYCGEEYSECLKCLQEYNKAKKCGYCGKADSTLDVDGRICLKCREILSEDSIKQLEYYHIHPNSWKGD